MQQMLDGAERTSSFPLPSKIELNVVAIGRGNAWACGTPQAALPWPDPAQFEASPELTVDIMNDAAGTFPDNTGLGWDELHPKAVRRCGVEAVRALIRILIVAELLGDWPAAVGVIMICLLPQTRRRAGTNRHFAERDSMVDAREARFGSRMAVRQ